MVARPACFMRSYKVDIIVVNRDVEGMMRCMI